MKAFFITGTDTDVGKTVATTLLTHAFLQNGVDASPYKPIQSGALVRDGQLVSPDAEMYQILPQLQQQSLASFLYPLASSPHLAAEREGAVIPIDQVIQQIDYRSKDKQLLLIEGAGGLYVPLNRAGYCMIDLMMTINSPVIVVARTSLGTINHTMLTIEALKQRGLIIAGIILVSTIPEDPAIEADNRKMIERLAQVPVIGTIPYLEQCSIDLQTASLRTDIVKDWDMNRLKEWNHESSTTI